MPLKKNNNNNKQYPLSNCLNFVFRMNDLRVLYAQANQFYYFEIAQKEIIGLNLIYLNAIDNNNICDVSHMNNLKYLDANLNCSIRNLKLINSYTNNNLKIYDQF